MSKRLVGEVAIVTASTKGIGFAIARRLAQEGAHVIISSRRKDNVDEAVSLLKKDGLSVSGLVCHVGNEAHRAELVNSTLFGKIDILVNNAAVNPYFGTLMTTPVDAWSKILDINVTAPFLLAREVAKHMVERKKGSIVFIASIVGIKPDPLLGAYSVSKTAMLGVSKGLAANLAADGVRVNAVCPGIVKTHFAEMIWNSGEASEKLQATIPMKRFGEPDDIAGIVAYMASSDSSWMTGEEITVSGGFARL